MWFLLLPVILVVFVAGLYHGWQVLSLIVNYGVAHDWADWFTRGNIMAWVLVFVGMAIAGWLIRLVFRLLRFVFVAVSAGVTGSAWVGVIVYWVLSFGGSLMLVGKFISWAETNPSYSSFFAATPWWSAVFLFLAFFSLLWPSIDREDA